MTSLLPPVSELCEAEYTAVQFQVPNGHRQVMIVAEGNHGQVGYQVYFTQSPLDIFPPQFALWHIKPSAKSPVYPARFTRWQFFEAAEDIQEVVVHDAKGEHPVAVEQVQETEVQPRHPYLKNILGLFKDGPFPM